MELSEKKPTEQFSTCLFKYWVQEDARDLAHVVASQLTKQIGSTARRKQGRYELSMASRCHIYLISLYYS